MESRGEFSSGTGRISVAVFLIVVIFFALQAFSPLRLNTDAVVLLSMADSAAQGHGFLDDGEKTAFPPGYPALIVALQFIGCAHSWGIIWLNIALILVGLAGAYQLIVRSFFENRIVALNLCTMFLLSFVVVKHFTIPVTEAPFFCSSMWCLALMSESTAVKGRKLIAMLALAWLLVFVSILFRRVGVALIPPLIFTMAFRPESVALWKGASTRTRVLAGLICAGLGLATVTIVASTSAVFDLQMLLHKADLSRLPLQILSYRLTEFGQLLANVPASKVPGALKNLFPCLGVLLLLLTLGGLYSRRKGHVGSTGVFLVCYMAIMFVWPAEADPRFWLPVMPLLIAYSSLAVQEGMNLGLPRAVVAFYCIAFSILGLTSLAFSARITFAGSRFPDAYGDATLSATYCAALESCPQGFDNAKVDPKILRLLRKYN